MSQLETITETTLVDCNQRSSSQYLGGNRTETAIFTNEIGQGIKLETGDEVSIHGIMVSGIGAGADTIEFKGDYLTDYKNKPKSHTSNVTRISQNAPLLAGDDKNIMGGFQYVTNKNEDVVNQVRDNDCEMTINFYKNSNGESTIFLPRRFGFNPSLVGLDRAVRKIMVKNWITIDEISKGRCNHFIKSRNFVSTDYQYYRDGFVSAASKMYPDGHFIQRTDNSKFTQLKLQGNVFYTATITNSIDDKVYPTPSIIDRYPSFGGEPQLDPAIYGFNDATRPYEIFRQNINMKVEKGFNSPTNIASQLTDILRLGGETKPFEILDATGKVQSVGATYETNTWKPQRSAGFGTFSSADYQSFQDYDPVGDPASIKDSVFEYQANYENLFVKRPDLFMNGRECNDYKGHLLINDITHADTTTHFIQTDIIYNETNLKALSELFKAQELYPDLFDNDNFWKYLSIGINGTIPSKNIGNSRFIHMNQFGQVAQEDMLGNDDYEKHTAVGDESLQSLPVFFKYDKTLMDIETGGHDINRLSYGFATKHQIVNFADVKAAHIAAGGSRLQRLEDGADTFYIRLHPELVGGLHKAVFTSVSNNVESAPQNIPALDRLCGWDYHFSAYSTCALLNWTGMLDKDFYSLRSYGTESMGQNTQQELPMGAVTDIGKLVTQTYNGANDPLFNYDTISNKFYFSRLHTAEVAGQPFEQAGGFWTDAIPASTLASKEVWKMNKLFQWTTYTPDLCPYYRQVEIGINGMYVADVIPNGWGYLPATATADSKGILPAYNIQSQPWTPFDAQGGVMIEDFGYDPKDFQDGLWGILGFTYEQFNSPTHTRVDRINETNLTSLRYPTTNCEVISSDTANMISNSFGANMFGNRVAINGMLDHEGLELRAPSAVYVDPKDFQYTLGNLLSIPAVVEDTESIFISAINLPRKVLQPYYTIRSDLIDKAQYIGSRTGNQSLPVMSILQKQYSSSDYTFLGTNAESFTITNPRTITSITSMICDPDGSVSSVNLGSAVIYSIRQFRKRKNNLIADLLEEEKNEQKGSK